MSSQMVSHPSRRSVFPFAANHEMPRASHRLYPIPEDQACRSRVVPRMQQQQQPPPPQHHHHHPRQQPPVRQQQSKDTTIYVEIAPHVTARLRGARETWQCVKHDFFIPACCVSCRTNLFCIMDANFMICPVCKVVGPLQGGADQGYNGGVGIGFTLTDLQAWQCEILARRRQNARASSP